MTIVVETPTSQRITRVTNDIVDLMRMENDASSRARVQRWLANTLQDATSRRKWWFLERLASTTLTVGQDLIDLQGDIEKVIALFGPKRLNKLPLTRITELRMAAADSGTSNAGPPTHYALEHREPGIVRAHLWPAPPGSSMTFTADAATDLLSVSDTSAMSTGRALRFSSTTTLPAPLVASTTYYAIVIDSTTIKVATTAANASAGTAIDLTDAGTGTHTLFETLTSFASLYTRPMDLAVVPDLFETLIANGVIGLYGRHWDRDVLAQDPENFETRYEKQLKRAAIDSHDIERVQTWDDELPAASSVTADSDTNTATSVTVPASLTGIGHVTIETGSYPLTVG